MDGEFSEQLKEQQRYWWEHLQAAGTRGVTLAEYARAEQLDSDALYRWRALFRRKGLLGAEEQKQAPRPRSQAKRQNHKPAGCSAVRVESSGAVTVSVGALLQVQCTSLPSPQWLAELSHCLQERH